MTGIFGAAAIVANVWLAAVRVHAQSTASSALSAQVNGSSVLVASALPQ